MKRPICLKCNIPMKIGQFINQTHAKIGSKIWRGGPGETKQCWKCPNCGHSKTIRP